MVRGMLSALGIVLLVGALRSQPADQGYTPVAPAAALHAAIQSNLKQYGDWVNDQDFASAASTARGVIALAQLCRHHGHDAATKQRAAALVDACAKLPTAAAAKNAADCQKAIDQCGRVLAELAKSPTGKAPASVPGFKPPAATKTWMLLMDAAYADAKFAKTSAQVEQLAFALAEEANASAFLRNDAAWRKQSFEVRDAALLVAQRSGDLAASKKLLKEVYNRCEACHQRYQK